MFCFYKLLNFKDINFNQNIFEKFLTLFSFLFILSITVSGQEKLGDILPLKDGKVVYTSGDSRFVALFVVANR